MSGAATPARDTVAVVTINWNAATTTLECVAALRRSAGADWHLYIVDNASGDGSAARLDGLGDDVTLIRSPVNGGWTGGNNLGIDAALAAGFDWVFLLNNDAFVEPDTLAVLLREAKARASQGVRPVLGPVHRGHLGVEYDFSASAIDRKTGIPAWVDLPEPRGPVTPTAYISGAGLFAHREHFDRVGRLDDRFYLNFDDTDWCRRAAAADFPLLMVRDAVIRHIGSASIGGRESPLQTYFLARNRLLYAEKHCSWIERLRLLRRYVWQARAITGEDGAARWLGKLITADGGVLSAFRQGVLDYILRRFGDCPPPVRAWHAASARAAR